MASTILQEKEILIQLARSWNNLDTCFIEPLLAVDFIYESQWALIPLQGKIRFITYLKAKFEAIKSEIKSGSMTVTAEIAHHPLISDRPCIVLTQKSETEFRQVTVLVNCSGEKLKRIDVCFIPDPAKAKLSGRIPK